MNFLRVRSLKILLNLEPDEEDTQLPPILGRPSRFQSSFEINPNADFLRRRSPSSEKSTENSYSSFRPAC